MACFVQLLKHEDIKQISISADDIKHASKIIFPNGDLDPWMPGGVSQFFTGFSKCLTFQMGYSAAKSNVIPEINVIASKSN